jgi:glutamate-ammonia-ligase adenylyltransferase
MRIPKTLVEVHRLFSAIFQWQRLTIEGAFDPAFVPPANLKCLAVMAGLPDARVLLTHLNEMRRKAREIFKQILH